MNKQQNRETKEPLLPQKANKGVKPNVNSAMSRIGNDVPVAMLKRLPPAYQRAVISKWGNRLAQDKITTYNNECKGWEDSAVVQAKSNIDEESVQNFGTDWRAIPTGFKPLGASKDEAAKDEYKPEIPKKTEDEYKRDITAEPDATRVEVDDVKSRIKKLTILTKEVNKDIKTLRRDLPFPVEIENRAKWVEGVKLLYEVKVKMIALCKNLDDFRDLMSKRQRYEKYSWASGVVSEIHTIGYKQNENFGQIDDNTWKELLKDPNISPEIASELTGRRDAYLLHKERLRKESEEHSSPSRSKI